MILSWFEVESRRMSNGEPVAVVGVEAVRQQTAFDVAKAIMLDRCRLPGEAIDTTVRPAMPGLASRPGEDRRARDRIRRRAQRWADQFAAMEPDERQAVLRAILRLEIPGRPAVIVHSGATAGGSPTPLPLIPIKPRAVISDGASNFITEAV